MGKSITRQHTTFTMIQRDGWCAPGAVCGKAKRKEIRSKAMEKKNKVFAERLMLTRRKDLTTQAELAEMVGVSGQTISAYERNLQTPSLDIAVGIADALGVSLDWLAGREETK